jgi:hypothetical protein
MMSHRQYETVLLAEAGTRVIPAASDGRDGWVAERLDRHRNRKGAFEQQGGHGVWLKISERSSTSSSSTVPNSRPIEVVSAPGRLSSMLPMSGPVTGGDFEVPSISEVTSRPHQARARSKPGLSGARIEIGSP